MKTQMSGKRVAVIVVATVVLSVIGGTLYERADDPSAEAVESVAVAEEPADAPAEPSETKQIAAKVADEFDATWRSGGYTTPAADVVTGFAEDLDPWDGSIEVRTSLYPDAEGEQFAAQVGAAVLAVAFPLGICKVDVLASNGRRLAEHESKGPGC